MNNMKKILAYSLFVAMTFSGVAQTKNDIGSRARLRGKSAPVEVVKTENGELKLQERVLSRTSQDAVVRAFITVKPGTSAEQLEDAGVTVRSLRGTLALGEFIQSNLADVESLDCVVGIRTESPVTQKMDLTRTAIGADKIHNGEGLPQAYTGKGVIAAIVDGGFDPNHINFQDEDGNYRIKQFAVYKYGNTDATGQQRVEVAKISGDKLKTIDTDAEDSFHATHTTGIMAGSYKGKLRTGYAIDFTKGDTKEVENPYYGIAYDADIVASGAEGGNLSDYFIALGCESILDYAYDHHQPVALNLSLGSNIGPHDGTSTICQYLDQIIDDDQVNTIVCISAGNEGDQPIAINKVLTADDNKVGSFIHPMTPQIDTYKNPRAGLIYIYSDTKETFEIQVQIYSKLRKTVTARFPLPASPEGAAQYWVSSAEWQQDSSDKIDNQLARYFNGYVGLAAETDQASGRYYGVIDFTLWDSPLANGNGNYIIGFQVTGKDGQRIDIYGDGNMTYFASEGVDGFENGGFDGTINDIACGKNTIIVGSYTTRNYWGSLDGNVYGYWDLIPTESMTGFTSFGRLIDGREMPHICAPGAAIISSTSKYYVDAAKAGDSYIQARVAKNGRMHDFQQSIGTSMAAPVVTGTIALWLEANPNLTAAEARDIMMRTAIKDDVVKTTGNPLQWGAGKLDAYEGLKEVIKSNSVSEIADDAASRIQIRRTGDRRFDILVPGASSVNADVFNTSGCCVMHEASNGNEISIDASAFAPGIYVVKVNNNAVKLSIN